MLSHLTGHFTAEHDVVANDGRGRLVTTCFEGKDRGHMTGRAHLISAQHPRAALSIMRRLFAVLLSGFLLFGFAPMAHADVAGLTPCSENARFQARAHLIVDGRWNHAGDFMIPGVMFLYIAGCIGWAGREYLKATRGKGANMKEIQIDLSVAFKATLASATWPLAAFAELGSKKLTEIDSNVTVSPR
jgi:photosystem I subunit 3